MEDRKIRYMTALDSAFPARLRTIPRPPQGIYVMGSLPDPDRASVAIIGARNNSEYGRAAAREFAVRLAGAGVQIISGLARGIDGIAQTAALQAGGMSFGVLGCGIDVVYPKENKELFEKIVKQGGLISEFGPGTEARAEFFPQRNRIISGLCDILLVVEARIHSGTAITVRCALEQGRDVFAVPGRISDPLSVGCNALIADGAGVATCPEDILQALGLIPKRKERKVQAMFKTSLKGLDPGLVNVLRCLDYVPAGVNELAKKSGLEVPELMDKLLRLELDGYILRSGATHYIKKIL